MPNKRKLTELGMTYPLAKYMTKATDALAINTVTATTGTLPTPDGATTIANAATPTVAELLELAMENRAKINAIITSLKA